MKKDYKILLLISFGLLTYNSAYGGFPSALTGSLGEGSSGEMSSSGGSSRSGSTGRAGSSSENCIKSSDSQTVSPDFMVDYLGLQQKIHFESSQDNLFEFSFPRLLNVDLCFKPDIRVDEHNNDKIIRIQNDVNLTLEEITLDKDLHKDHYKKSKYMIKQMSKARYKGKGNQSSEEYKKWLNNLSEEDKVLRCLAIKYPEYFEKLPGKKGKFRPNRKEMSSNSAKWPVGDNIMNSDSAEVNSNQSSIYYFGSPMGSRGNNKSHQMKEGNNFYSLSSNDESCFDVVKINHNKNYAVMTADDRAYYKMEQGCNGQDPLQYMRGLADLHENYTGNSKKVFSEFNDALLNMIGNNHKALKDEASDLLAKIKQKAKEIIKLNNRKKKKSSDDDDDDDDDDYDDEEDQEIEDATAEYVALLGQYDSKITENVSELLIGLEEKMKESGITKETKKKITSRMKELRKVAGMLAKDHEVYVKIHGKHMSGSLIKKIKKIVDPSKGEDILRAFYRSKQIGKVCRGSCGGKSITMKKAKRNIEKRIVKFDAYDRGEWLEYQAAYQGYDAPLKSKRKSIAREQKSIMRDLYRYKARETREYNEVCGTQYNAMDCLFFKNNMEHDRKYFIGDLQKRSGYVKLMGNQYNDLKSLYSSGLRYNQENRNLSDGGIDFSRFFNSNSGLDPNMLHSLHGQDPFSMSNGVQGLMHQQQLINGQQPGSTHGYNPAQMQQSPFIQNAGGAANGLGNPLYGGRRY